MKHVFFSCLAIAVLGSLPCEAAQVAIGTLIFGNPLSTLQGFEVDNNTGGVYGCDAGNDIPVCTVLAFENTTLRVTLSDNSTITRNPAYSFLPGSCDYGTSMGDDPAESFLFDIDPSLSIVSATFSGSVSPDSFLVTDGTSQTTFFSSGLFSVTLDLSGSPALAGDTIYAESPVESAAPEPSTAALIAIPAGLSALVRRKRSSRH